MHVLISGAGIAGPALAWGLAKIGVDVTVVEKCKAILPHGQSIDIQGSAVTVIKRMGLLDQVKGKNTFEKGTQFINPHGQPFASFPVQSGSTASFSSEFEILRGDLAALLFDSTKNHPNIRYRLGTMIKDVLSNDENSVKVKLSSGEIQEFDLLVAADGSWSSCRKQCFPSEDISIRDMGMYAAYWTIPREQSDDDWWNIYHALGSKIITLRPDPYGTSRAMFTAMPCGDFHSEGWRIASRSSRKEQEIFLRTEFQDSGWQAQRMLDAMEGAEDFYFQSIQQVKMTKWSNSRIICLGDTAYAPTPLTGMGTSLAIIGAYILAGEIGKLQENEHPSRALEAYESMFRPFVEKMQNIPFFIPAIAHPATAWKRWLLQSFLSVLSMIVAIPWVTRNLQHDDGFSLPQYTSLDQEVGF